MKFWDSSAVILIILDEPFSSIVQPVLDEDRSIAVWWSTPVECASALARRDRERTHPPGDIAIAFELLDELAEGWYAVAPVAAIAVTARRLVRVHPLRAADALQLAAAIAVSAGHPSSLPFVCLDVRLRDAASREGLNVLPATLR